jgi:hypothetical protein
MDKIQSSWLGYVKLFLSINLGVEMGTGIVQVVQGYSLYEPLEAILVKSD